MILESMEFIPQQFQSGSCTASQWTEDTSFCRTNPTQCAQDREECYRLIDSNGTVVNHHCNAAMAFTIITGIHTGRLIRLTRFHLINYRKVMTNAIFTHFIRPFWFNPFVFEFITLESIECQWFEVINSLISHELLNRASCWSLMGTKRAQECIYANKREKWRLCQKPKGAFEMIERRVSSWLLDRHWHIDFIDGSKSDFSRI